MKYYRYEIFVGLHDKNTNKEIPVNKIKNDITEIANLFHISFSLSTQIGGYLYKNNDFLVEKSIKLTFVLKKDKRKSAPLLDSIKQMYNQESVLITRTIIKSKYLTGEKENEVQ